MAHFYAKAQGNKGPTSRCGTKSSGITATATGWDIGATISIKYDKTLETDVLTLYLTDGTSGSASHLAGEYINQNGRLIPTARFKSKYPEVYI